MVLIKTLRYVKTYNYQEIPKSLLYLEAASNVGLSKLLILMKGLKRVVGEVLVIIY